MNNLERKELTLSSQLVAEMIGEEHSDLLKKVRKYEEFLGEGKISPTDYFIKTTYRTAQNKEQPCYRITRKGCDLIAHKLTGKKGVLFTAQYIECFERLKAKLTNQPRTPANLEELITSPELVIRLAQELIEARKEIASLKGLSLGQETETKEATHKELYTTTDIAALYGMGAKTFNSLL
ncbi:Rha family transcriptional regulator, partial [uncultured Helicobacter sp.]|uniref:Rha family transcriptional regulator n=1 Tax=uncultured Helicobacter sp. TaxID=175537 RepID=UPI00260B0B4F